MDRSDLEGLNLRLGGPDFLFRRIYFFETIDSTNSYLRRNLDGYSSGDIILARTQTAGRGRLGRDWVSDCGGLYFSILLKNKWDIRDLNFLTLLVAVSLDRTLKSLGFKSLIKWPNDIFLDNKKLAGILVENIVHNFNNTIIGIGINIDTKDFKGPLVDKSTSLALEGGTVDKISFLTSLLENLDGDIKLYSSNFDGGDFIDYIKANSLNLNEDVDVVLGQEKISGKLEDILADGSIVISDKNNHSRVISYGEIINQ